MRAATSRYRCFITTGSPVRVGVRRADKASCSAGRSELGLTCPPLGNLGSTQQLIHGGLRCLCRRLYQSRTVLADLSRSRHIIDGSLDCVVVDLNATVGQQDTEAVPVFGEIGERFAERRFASDAAARTPGRCRPEQKDRNALSQTTSKCSTSRRYGGFHRTREWTRDFHLYASRVS